MDKYIRNIEFMDENTLFLNIFPGTQSKSGEYNLYEDDGISKNSESSYTLIQSQPYSSGPQSNKKWKIDINKTKGEYKKQVPRPYIIRIVGLPPPESVSVGVNNKIIPYISKDVYTEDRYSYASWSMKRDR